MKTKKAIAAGLFSGFLWALTGFLYDELKSLHPMIQTFGIILTILFVVELMSGFGALISLLSLDKKRVFKPIQDKRILLSLFSGLFGGPIGMFCYLSAIDQIGISYTASISSLYPILATLLSLLFLKETITLQGILGIFLALGAGSLLSQNAYEHFSWIGLTLAFICALSWGIEVVLASYVMQSNQVSYAYCFRQLGSISGYGILLIFLELHPIKLFTLFQDLQFNAFLLAIILCSLGSYLLYYFAIDQLKPIKAMMLNMTYGIWAVILGYVFGQINGSYSLLFSVSLILLGTILVLKQRRRQ